MKNRDILAMVESIANERAIDPELVFQAVEQALAVVTTKASGEDEVLARVSIDRATGDYETFRVWNVVADEDLVYGIQEIPLTEAKKLDENLEVGDHVEEQMENVPLDRGRIAAQQAKQVILQKVREAERAKIVNDFERRVGELVNGTVKRVMRDQLIIDLGNNAEGLLPRDQLIAREAFRLNDRVRAYIAETRPETRGAQVLLSRTCPEFLIELFKIEVPEIGEEVITIPAAARDPGSRAKIAVKTNDGRIDPIGACVGMRGSRVQAVSNELNGERIDIVLWDDNPAQMVINAMAPAEVLSIVADEDTMTMDLAVAEEQLSQAIGRNGQNVRLASELTGWKLNVLSEESASEKQESEYEAIKALFTKELDVDEDVAEVLIQAGFTSLDEIAYIPAEEMLAIGVFDEDTVQELQQRASDLLLAKELGADTPADDLLSLDGMTAELADKLAENGILTREDLAEQAVPDLEEIGVAAEVAADLIMKARAHWFEDSADKDNA